MDLALCDLLPLPFSLLGIVCEYAFEYVLIEDQFELRVVVKGPKMIRIALTIDGSTCVYSVDLSNMLVQNVKIGTSFMRMTIQDGHDGNCECSVCGGTCSLCSAKSKFLFHWDYRLYVNVCLGCALDATSFAAIEKVNVAHIVTRSDFGKKWVLRLASPAEKNEISSQ